LSQQALTQVLRQLPISTNRNVLVDSNTADDAGVYRLDRHRALVQTVDFFTPIVDNPFAYGQIAAANALSDVFAMGGQPLTALNIMGFPAHLVSPKTITAILRGGLEKASEVGCAIIGGHSIRNPEPIYGLAVTGIVDVRRMMTNAKAKPGDVLVLTKPLGTGIVTTGIKRGLTSRMLAKKTVALMAKINSAGAKLAHRGLVHAATDVTGFGLTGHLAALCRASGVSAIIDLKRIPIIDREVIDLIERDCIPGGTRDNLKLTRETVDWGRTKKTQRILLSDAQTSGGLLLSVGPRRLPAVLSLLKRNRAAAATVIGLIARSRKRLICISV
jgi:selenide, water dikinase